MQKEYLKLKINEIKPYEKNPRKNDNAVPDVAESIKEVGYITPIVVDENNVILCGHTRLKALKKNGEKEVDGVLRVSGLTDEQKRKYRLLDNKTNEKAEWDFDLLVEEIADLDFSSFDLDWGIPETEEETEIIEDEPPEVDEETEPICKLGDIWQLGEHRLMCGDSTDKATIERLMDGVKADMVFTDPPYGVSASGGRSQTKDKLGTKAIANDELRKDDLTKFLSNFIKVMKYKDGASIYICYSWVTQKEFTEAILENNLKIKNCIIWDKKVFGLNGFKGYRPQYEMIYFCCKKDFEWYGDKAQSNIWQLRREIKREEQDNHPTPKPIELIAKALNNSSKQGDVILDVFGGSGSTLIACEQLNRKCYMVELSEAYCDVIIKRWENLTGKKAVKINV